jgi:Tol biopolymer transport system component
VVKPTLVWLILPLGCSVYHVPNATTSSAVQVGRITGGNPRVSPDGMRIIFNSDRSGRDQLYAMAADGSRPHLLRDGGGYASWSPDGLQIAITVEEKDNINKVIIAGADGSNPRIISEAIGNQAATWSPDGTRILFAAGRFPELDIYTMNPEGHDQQRVTQSSGFNYDPAWSPDGKTIAFVMGARGKGVRVYVMRIDGSDLHRISTLDLNEERPAWSPDGRKIAFQASSRGPGPHEANIYIADLVRGTVNRVTSHTAVWRDETPSWFPDGKRLAIQSDRDGATAVYTIDVDGNGLRRLTQ